MLLSDLDYTSSAFDAAYIRRKDGKVVEVWKTSDGLYNLFLEPQGHSLLEELDVNSAPGCWVDANTDPIQTFYCLEPIAAQSILYELLKE